MASPNLQATKAKKAKQWSVNASMEINKLTPKESDWALPGIGSIIGSRTRGSMRQLSLPSSSTTVSTITTTTTTGGAGEDDDDDTTATTSSKKPAYTRVILEVRVLEELLERNLANCPRCQAGLQINLGAMHTCCLATQP